MTIRPHSFGAFRFRLSAMAIMVVSCFANDDALAQPAARTSAPGDITVASKIAVDPLASGNARTFAMLLMSPGVSTNKLVCNTFKELFYSPTPAQRWVIVPVKNNVTSDAHVCERLDGDNNEYNYSIASDYIQKISESDDRSGPFLVVWKIGNGNEVVEDGYFNFSNVTSVQLRTYLTDFKSYYKRDEGHLKSGPVGGDMPPILAVWIPIHWLVDKITSGWLTK